MTVLSEIEYESNRLNCLLCLLYDYIESIKPQNQELCDIIVWGDYLIGFNDIHWQALITFCDVEIIPASITWNEPQHPQLDPPTEDDFLRLLVITDLLDLN
ncbi:MAG: hypothetical protein EA362_00375 [Saprospirales bacterium]|nr:MAG: hypothetical protein EA362_00375 [Saprospirales bacterium]